VGLPEATLSALLAPVSLDDFLSRCWLKQHLVCSGSPERFSHLLSWSTLNEILARHWREPFRFRLACQGRDLDPASYTDVGGVSPRIRAKEVTDSLRSGATLVFQGIDELHAPLRQLAESFEAFFRASTNVNVYAGWRALHGLDLHCDDQEIFILHLDGPKRWLVYGFSIDRVDRSQLTSASVPPEGAVLDRVLRAGDLLYLPKGCYHVAVPMNEPTLHLTVSVKMTASSGKRRPSFSLPWSATPELLPSDGNFLVTLIDSFVVMDTDSDSRAMELRCGDRRYRFPRSTQRILEQLQPRVPRPFARIVDAVADQLDEAMVRVLLAMLVREDLVAITTTARADAGDHA
jgi:cupin superfamily protein